MKYFADQLVEAMKVGRRHRIRKKSSYRTRRSRRWRHTQPTPWAITWRRTRTSWPISTLNLRWERGGKGGNKREPSQRDRSGHGAEDRPARLKPSSIWSVSRFEALVNQSWSLSDEQRGIPKDSGKWKKRIVCTAIGFSCRPLECGPPCYPPSWW